MGLLYDFIISIRKEKRCSECGCPMVADVDVEICEACVAEMYED